MPSRLAQDEDCRVSAHELRFLRYLREGAGGAVLSIEHRTRFLALGWIEQKFGGYVLTATGRYELEMRKKETGLSTLAHRWQRRSKELRRIAEVGTADDAANLLTIAVEWEKLAQQAEHLERLEAAEPLLE